MHPGEVLTNQAVVIDNGTGSIKAGMAGSTKPSCTVPTYEGRPKNPPCDALTLESEIFSGNKAAEKRGLLKLTYPMQHGIISDWDAMERLWGSVYNEMKVDPKEHPVLLTEVALNPFEHRKKMMQVFFETYSVPAFYIAMQAVLSLYSAARTSGLVLDVGEGASNSVPVMEGFALVHSIKRSEVAGRDVTDHLALLLRRAGKIFHTTAEMEIVKKIKETYCSVWQTPPKDTLYEPYSAVDRTFITTGRGDNASHSYNLPDGTTLTLGAERQYAPEILFNPGMIGLEYPGLAHLVSASVARTDLELRRELLEQIVLSGGTTQLQGFVDRVLNDLRKLQPKDTLIKVSAPSERALAAYSGGSILSSLPSFQQLWVTKTQYEEEGSTSLIRRAV